MERLIQYDPGNKGKFYDLLKQLRPHLTFEEFEKTYKKAKDANQYQLVGIEENGELLALMGHRILDDFVHGKHLYIDDLVVRKSERSKGLGSLLLNEAEKISKELGCGRIRLCTGVENERGRAFYERNGWEMKAVVYKRKCY